MISLIGFAVVVNGFNQTVSGHFVLVLMDLKSESLLRNLVVLSSELS